jgi:hypothetical protein
MVLSRLKEHAMKKNKSAALLVLLFVSVSLAFYSVQILLFHRLEDTAFLFFQDMAFLPLEVAIVTVILGRILNSREKRERLKKLKIAINAFFEETGTAFTGSLMQLSRITGDIKANLDITLGWTENDFQRAAKQIRGSDFKIECIPENLPALKTLLIEKRGFLLAMLSNPNLLEHESYTDMLWAVFHLTDELIARENLTGLPEPDLKHLSADAERALKTLLVQWLGYMAHLKANYPYLFSLEVRKDPFGENSHVVITG